MIEVKRVEVQERKRVIVLNSFYGTEYFTEDVVTRHSFEAHVDGWKLSVAQTEQAIRDANVCRCSNCVCCTIRSLSEGK